MIFEVIGYLILASVDWRVALAFFFIFTAPDWFDRFYPTKSEEYF